MSLSQTCPHANPAASVLPMEACFAEVWKTSHNKLGRKRRWEPEGRPSPRQASVDDIWRFAKVCRVAMMMRPFLASIG